ncbi:uncharacterized protein [Malus domestica]|uniref:uncharacterized protein n=1 Tax=Malus domestica TaxID=3750 RepID=UPI00397580BB
MDGWDERKKVLYVCVRERKKKTERKRDWAKLPNRRRRRRGRMGRGERKMTGQPEEGKEERREGEKRRREGRNGFSPTRVPARPAGVLHPFSSKFRHFSGVDRYDALMCGATELLGELQVLDSRALVATRNPAVF